MNELGTRLQRFRLRNGWSKRSVAEHLGVSIPSIIRWEEGIAEPNDYNRYKIEQFLDTTSLPSSPGRPGLVQLSLFPDPALGGTASRR